MIEDLRNYLRLSDTLISGGMPTAGQLEDAARTGVQVVINLAIPTSEKALPNESGLVEALGMKYISIPVEWEHPTRNDLEHFMKAMDDHREDKLLVHCQANYRASAFIALYRVHRLGWKLEAALTDVKQIWNPAEYPVWEKFIADNLPDNKGR